MSKSKNYTWDAKDYSKKKRDLFVNEIATRYLKNHPTDTDGVVHLGMMRLKVEAYKP